MQVAEPVAAPAPYSSSHLGHLSSTIHSNMTDSSPIRRTVIRQGAHNPDAVCTFVQPAALELATCSVLVGRLNVEVLVRLHTL